ncbi:MAG: hypothetical protein M0P13_01900 [Fibrobacteraceae bacterium]|nr:hypothetical protein [Fibrobacteraceae bacterium]
MKKILVTILIILFAAVAGTGLYFHLTWEKELSPIAYFLIEKDLLACGSTTKETKCVITGDADWLFYQESQLSLVHSWEDNTKQIIAFNDSLKNRGIQLIVVPVPDKLLVESDKYLPFFDEDLIPSAYRRWAEKLNKNGVILIDALDEFKRIHDSIPVFEPYESHCTYEGRSILAKLAANKLKYATKDLSKKSYTLRDTTIKGTGNLFHLKYGIYAHYKMKEKKVVGENRKNYKGPKKAPILVIGDSNAGEGLSRASDVGSLITKETGVETFSISKVGAANFGPIFFKGKSNFLENRRAIVWVFDGREIYGHFRNPQF